MSTTKAIILARVSTKEQENDAQLNPLRDYCVRKGFDVLREIPLEESAFKRTRKKFHGLVAELKRDTRGNKSIALCCDKIDRLGRGVNEDVLDVIYMVRAGKLELHFPSDWLTLTKDSPAAVERQFLSGLSDGYYYSAASRDNQKRYQAMMRQQGRYWSKAPLGYMHITIGGTKDIILDAKRRDLMKEAFELRATYRYTYRELATIMNGKGLTTNSKKNGPVTQSILQCAMTNPFYMGYFYMEDGKTLKRHIYEPLISEELWRRCQDVNPARARLFKKDYIFTDVARCGHCECSISPYTTTKKGVSYRVYMRCTRAKGSETCPGENLSEEDGLGQVKVVLTTFRWPDVDIEKAVDIINQRRRERSGRFNRDKVQLEADLENLELEIKKIVTMRMNDEITEEIMKLMLTDLENKRSLKKSQLEGHSMQSTQPTQLTADTLKLVLNEAPSLFESLQPVQKREFIKRMVANCQLLDKQLDFTLKNPWKDLSCSKNKEMVDRRRLELLTPSMPWRCSTN